MDSLEIEQYVQLCNCQTPYIEYIYTSLCQIFHSFMSSDLIDGKY